MLKIAICEDERRYAEDLEWGIKVWAANEGINVGIKKYKDSTQLFDGLIREGMFDIFFLDIEIDEMNGIEIAELVREEDVLTTIIFVSQYEDYYKEAYNVHPFHFLSKPINPQKLEKTMDAYMAMRGRGIETFTFHIRRTRYSVRVNEIIYFFSENRHITVVCENRKYTFYGKLGVIQKEMEEGNSCFLRIHQSYLVNMDYVKEFHYKELILFNGQSLHISRENRKKIRELQMLLLDEEF
ncbi:MAG: response regulator transcription factor [Lachnospiraceae bacterium]|nr:response regulator transcription factor [Lachnospiraceae bacterium]